MGRPAHEPTPISRRNVEALAGYGVPEVDIAGVIGIDPKTLRKHYPQELRYGHVKSNAKVAADEAAFATFLTPLRKTRWFVYSKRPFAGPKAVLAYLSRYTHRVAISIRGLIAADESGARVKDYFLAGRGIGYLDDGTKIIARASVCATGIEYRRLNLPNEDRLFGAGVYYGAMARRQGCLRRSIECPDHRLKEDLSWAPASNEDAAADSDLVRKLQFDRGLASKAAASHGHPGLSPVSVEV